MSKIRYQVRSKELIDLVNEIKSQRLIISPHFQRNLVWRNIHKVDFIKTILLGYPFPQIFIAKGSIDLESMTTTSCIVDGQQRMSTIFEYVSNKFKVDNKFFSDLIPEDREAILKYQIPIIDLDIPNDSDEIKEIFKRLNRTFYSLNSIEKLSTEYATSEFMLFSKHLTGEIRLDVEDDDFPLSIDPNIPDDFISWSKQNDSLAFKRLIVEGNIFTPYEISRQIHLMFTLNLVSTCIGDIYTRNELAIRFLDDYKEEFINKDSVIENFEIVSLFILELKLDEKSYWLNKANIFSLFTLFYKNIQLLKTKSPITIKQKLDDFEKNLPQDYQFVAKEGVNNKKERLLRNDHLKKILIDT